MTDDTRVRLQEYIQDIMREKFTSIFLLLDERKEQLKLAAETLEVRLAHLNELRGNILTKSEYESRHHELETKIEPLQRWIDRQEGKQFRMQMLNIVAILIAAAAVIVHILK